MNWDFPILLGTSRKSVIGLTLDLPPEEREEGTLVHYGLRGTERMRLCAGARCGEKQESGQDDQGTDEQRVEEWTR